jgi:hypothetical protein
MLSRFFGSRLPFDRAPRSPHCVMLTSETISWSDIHGDVSDQPFLAPMSKGWMLPLIHHAHDLMIAGAFTAWSVNPIHNAGRMNSKNLISRKLGLLDGNFSGMLLPSDWKKCCVTKDHGLIYDVEWSASLWSRGHRFVRYMNMCANHKYRRVGGQQSVTMNPDARRALENACLKKLAAKFPKLLVWKLKKHI